MHTQGTVNHCKPLCGDNKTLDGKIAAAIFYPGNRDAIHSSSQSFPQGADFTVLEIRYQQR